MKGIEWALPQNLMEGIEWALPQNLMKMADKGTQGL
jgi:hypothetical protein